MFDDTNLKIAHKQAIIISVSFFFTLIIYVALSEFILKEMHSEFNSSIHNLLRYIFIILSAGQIVLMMILKNRILSGATKIKLNMGEYSDSNDDEQKEKKDSEITEMQFIQRLRSSHIITYALCESIALYGIILYIFGKDKTEFYAFIGVCVFMMTVNFPKYDDWKSRLGDVLNNM